ncbi:hypothetical protein CVIRNUC_000667 [Coccomyxa viridis]|uniref:Eukaryotic translation initiation factor 3 subunit K n=1 Tax=Coccomyxa viridis TaxID=1274662 RepID=A0AAV1HUE1_9CHLO|nr:hypothetical protein CVIRNUC_000667 [Coccomyxa viridis]
MQVTGADRYDPQKLQQLESHVDEQVKNGTYNPEANLALLRHYQFAPERSNINCIATMLIKAQMQLPSHDFTQLLQLIPERVQDEQPLSALIALTQHLEGARFPDYWQTADSCKSILGSVPGYYDAIRKYILYVISVTCQKVTSSLLAESLRLDEAGVDALMKEHSNGASAWALSQSKTGQTIITFPKIEPSSQRSQGNNAGGFRIDMAQLGALIQAAY